MNNDIDSSANQVTIIVADNSATLRLIIKRVLEEDYNVLEADSEAKVISLVDMALSSERSAESSGNTGDARLAILVIGFELSGGHGLALITKLREKYSKQELPIVLNTSNNRRENIKQAIAAGINDYIVKPFPPELLVVKAQNLSTPAPQHTLDMSEKVSQIPFFKDVPAQVVAHAMTSCSTTSELDAGTVVCTQGEHNFDLFILLEGHCDVLYNHRKISEISAIESIGEMGFLENEQRSATVVTSQHSILVTFDKEKFDNFLNQDRAVSEIICKNVIHTLSTRIKKSNELLEQLKNLSAEKG